MPFIFTEMADTEHDKKKHIADTMACKKLRENYSLHYKDWFSIYIAFRLFWKVYTRTSSSECPIYYQKFLKSDWSINHDYWIRYK